MSTITTSVTTTTSNLELKVISYSKIARGDADELDALYKACEEDGFWYLDLNGQDGEPISVVQDVASVFNIVEEFFDLKDEEKIKYDVDEIGPWKLNGYTPFGRNAGLVGDGKKYGVEGYTFPRDGLCNPSVKENSFELPPVLEKHSQVLSSFMNQLHDIGLCVLGALDRANKTDPEAVKSFLASNHQPSLASTTCLTAQRYPSLSENSINAGLAAHTDVGSLTILFCGERGLQALNPATNEWQYVEPKKGCAVINVGDSLRFLSKRQFRSALHRVVPYPGVTIENRFSCAYFIRPNLDTEFLDEDGNRWKSIDWHMRKYKSYRSGAAKA